MRQKVALTLGLLVVGLLLTLNWLNVRAEPLAPGAFSLNSGTDINEPLGDGAVFALNGYLYHVGGWAGTAASPSNSIYRSQLSNGVPQAWSPVGASNNTRRFGAASVVYNGRAYLLGGYNGSAIQNTIHTSQDGTTWNAANITLPQALNFPAVAVSSGRLYIAGGLPGPISSMWSAALDNNGNLGIWQSEANLPRGLTTQLAAYNGCLFVIGGKDAAGIPHTEIYSARTNTNGLTSNWTQSTSLPQALALHSVAVREEAGTPYLYVFGGELNSGIYSNQIYYTTINVANCTLSSNWSSANLPDGKGRRRAVSTVAEVNGYRGLYVIGGQTQDGTWSKNTFYNALQVAVPTPTPSIQIQKWATPAAPVGYRDLITYVVGYSNTWVYSQTIVITDQIPADTGLQASPGATVQPGQVLRWEIPNVVSHTGGIVSYTVLISPSARIWELAQSSAASWLDNTSSQALVTAESSETASDTPHSAAQFKRDAPQDTTLTALTITGPLECQLDTNCTFAVSANLTATLPLTFTWNATDQAEPPHTDVTTITNQMTWQWASPGEKILSVTAANADGGLTSEPYTVTVYVPISSLTILGPTEGAVGSLYSFTADLLPAAATSPITYNWQIADTLDYSTTQGAVDVRWSMPGPHTITVTAENNWSVVTATHDITLSVPPSAANLVGPDTVTTSQSAYFIVTIDPLTATAPITYVWSALGTGEVITHANQTTLWDYAVFTWTTPITPDNVTLTASTVWGEVTATRAISVSAQPLAYQPITDVTLNGPATGQLLTTYTFTGSVQPNNATKPIYFIWDATDQSPVFHTQNSTTQDTAGYVWTTPGTKSITLTVMNGGAITHTYHTIDIAPAVDSLMLVGPGSSGAINTSYVFTATVAATTTTPLTYTWQATDLVVQRVTNTTTLSSSATFTWTVSGPKVVTVSVENERGVAIGSYPVTIDTPPARVSIVGPTTGAANSPFYLIAEVAPATTTLPITYTWSADGQSPVSHLGRGDVYDYISFTWGISNTYRVTVTADNGWQTVTATQRVTITAPVPFQNITALTITPAISTGRLNTAYPFTATVEPYSVTLPLHYIWEATDLPVQIHHGATTLTDSATFQWTTYGSKQLTLTVLHGQAMTTTARTIDIEPNELTTVALTGPISPGRINTSYAFTATTNPTATLPITYEWQATEQVPQVFRNVFSTTQVAAYEWQLPGQKSITVTATGAGGIATDHYTLTIVLQNARLTYTLAYTPSIVANKGVLITDVLPIGWSVYKVMATSPYTYAVQSVQDNGLTQTLVSWRLTGPISQSGTVTVIACRNTDLVTLTEAINRLVLDDASKQWTSTLSQTMPYLAQLPPSCDGGPHPSGPLPRPLPDFTIRNQAWISTTYLANWQASNEVVTFWPESYLYLPMIRK